MRPRWWLLLCLAWLLGCGSEGDPEPPTSSSGGSAGHGAGGAGGAGGEEGCPPGQVVESDGHCEPAGIPAELCGDGFEPDGRRGCEPVLPSAPCPSGQLAVPGDTECEPIASCGAAPWGDIETAADTQYVDFSYGAGDSEGSSAKPWTTIQAGIDAAASGAVVAVAAGIYAEDLIVDKPVVLWGRCPTQVEVVGGSSVTVAIESGANDAVIRGLQIRAAQSALRLRGADRVVLRELWLLQPSDDALIIEDQGALLHTTLERLLIEDNASEAVSVLGGCTVDAEQVATTWPVTSDPSIGFLLTARDGLRPSLRLSRAVLRGHVPTAVYLRGADATLESVVILSGDGPVTGDQYGAQALDHENELSSLTLRDSLVEGEFRFGASTHGGELLIERSVLRGGRIYCEPSQSAGHAIGSVRLRRSVVEAIAAGYGVQTWACDLQIEASIIRDIEPDPSNDIGGLGVTFGDYYVINLAEPRVYGGELRVDDSLVSQVHEVGILLVAGRGQVEHTRVEQTAPRTEPGEPELFGDGIAAIHLPDPSQLEVRDCAIVDNARAGIGNFSSQVTVADNELWCNAFALAGQELSDAPYSYDNAGGNRCGCDAEEPCQVVSPGLAPPVPPLSP